MLDIPRRGIERAAATLLHLDAQTRLDNVTPKYMTAVYRNGFDEAAQMLHDMGYGMTPQMVKTAVYEVTNEGGTYVDLAAKLEAMKAV